MKRLVWLLLITGVLTLAAVPEASANGSQYRSYDRHYDVRHGHGYPTWLRRNYDFHRWYWRSHHHNDFNMSWSRLFDVYRYERKYHHPYHDYDRRRHNRHRKHHRHH